MKKNLLLRVGSALMCAIGLTLALGIAPVYAAEPGLLNESGTEIAAADAKEITLDTSNMSFSGLISENISGNELEMEMGKTYSITYKDALKYGGKTLSVKTTVTMIEDGRKDDNGKAIHYLRTRTYSRNSTSDEWGSADSTSHKLLNGTSDYDTYPTVKVVSDTGDTGTSRTIIDVVPATTKVYRNTDEGVAKDRLAVSWTLNKNTKVKWTITTLDSSGKEIGTVLLTGIQDPDESEYLIPDIGDRNVFYVAADYSSPDADYVPSFGEAFEITSGGIIPVLYDSEGNRRVDSEGNPVHGGTGFENGLILMSLNSKATIELDTMTYNGGYLAVPFFYSPIYKVTYELDGGENDPDNPDSYMPGDEHTIKPPTKPGYKFTGWKEGDKIKDTDTGDKTFTAQWDPIYTITYDANGGQGTMEDQEFMGSDKTKKSKDNEFTNPGKTFRGFYAYVTDPETGEETPVLDENGEPILFENATDMAKYFEGKPGGTSIRMEAQWGVTVTYYDPETGKTYQKTVIPEDGEEPEPPEDPTRDGYTFKGWKRSVDEDGNILYEAMWEENPAPVTPIKPVKPVKPRVKVPSTGDIITGAAGFGAAGLAAILAAYSMRKKK